MLGELALAMFGGALPDLRNRPGGDDKIDQEFWLQIDGGNQWTPIDAKGSPTPIHLIVKPDRLEPQWIYVLCGPSSQLYIHTGFLPYIKGIGHLYDCLGWAWGYEMAQMPLKQFRYDAPPAHAKLQSQLHQMNELKEMYLGQWRHHTLEAQPSEAWDLSETSDDPAPDLQDLVRQYGGFGNIPSRAWELWDVQISRWRARHR